MLSHELKVKRDIRRSLNQYRGRDEVRAAKKSNHKGGFHKNAVNGHFAK